MSAKSADITSALITRVNALETKLDALNKTVKELTIDNETLKKNIITVTELCSANKARFLMSVEAEEEKKVEPVKQKRPAFQAKQHFSKFAHDNLHGIREKYLKDIKFDEFFEANKKTKEMKGLSTLDIKNINEEDRNIIYYAMACAHYSACTSAPRTAISKWLRDIVDKEPSAATSASADKGADQQYNDDDSESDE